MENEIKQVGLWDDAIKKGKAVKVVLSDIYKNQKLSNILSQLHFFTCYSCDQVFAIHYVNGKQPLCPTCGKEALTVLDLSGLLADLYQDLRDKKQRSSDGNI